MTDEPKPYYKVFRKWGKTGSARLSQDKRFVVLTIRDKDERVVDVLFMYASDLYKLLDCSRGYANVHRENSVV